VPDREYDAGEGADEQTKMTQEAGGPGGAVGEQRRRRAGSVGTQHQREATDHLVQPTPDRITLCNRLSREATPEKAALLLEAIFS
jgi:hypothetical protein